MHTPVVTVHRGRPSSAFATTTSTEDVPDNPEWIGRNRRERHQMTIVGNVVDEPRTRETKNGHTVTNFRVASTSRRFDREQERYVDNSTLYVNVTCWRGDGARTSTSPCTRASR